MSEKVTEITRRVITGTVSLIMVIALLAVMLPQQPASAAIQTVTCSTYHTVVSGENLSSIAVKYNTTVEALAAANDLKEPYTLFVGQRLCIPGTATSTATPSPGTSSTTKGPDFTIKAAANPFFVEIATVGYPARSSYYIRVFQTNNPSIAKKLGTFKTNKQGVAKRTVKLPRDFRNGSITICLKNATTDAVQCKVYNP